MESDQGSTLKENKNEDLNVEENMNVDSEDLDEPEHVNVGYQNWLALRQEWKRRPDGWQPQKRKPIDADQKIFSNSSSNFVFTELGRQPDLKLCIFVAFDVFVPFFSEQRMSKPDFFVAKTYEELSTHGQFSQKIPLPDLVKLIVEMWEYDGVN